MAPRPPNTLRRRRVALTSLAALVACAHWVLAVSGTCEKSVTYDELAHVTAGCAYWLHDDYRLQPENGNLPQRWCALPIVLTGCASLPERSHPAWRTADVWSLGEAFFHELGNDVETILFRGRAISALWGVGICLVVYFWSRDLFGETGGLISVASCALCPTLLANGPLMTSDACLAFLLMLSLWSIWSLLHRITPTRLAIGLLSISLLFIAKLSAVLVLPMTAVLLAVRWRSPQPLAIEGFGRRWLIETPRKRLATSLAVATLCGCGALATVWLAYGCRYDKVDSAQQQASEFYKFGTLERAMRIVPGASGRMLTWLAARHVLPEPYLYGAAYVIAHRKRLSFFCGEYSTHGRPAFFPYTFLVKTPLALFGLLALAMLGLLQAAKRNPAAEPAPVAGQWWYKLAPLWSLLAVYWGVSILSSLNIGHRHLLPTYPALHILAGGAALCFRAQRSIIITRSAVGLVAALVGLLAADSLSAYPHYLAYFNSILPQETAYRRLVDSSLDWGQDLPGLKRWLDENNPPHRKQTVHIAYFGKGSPQRYGIEATAINRSDGSRSCRAGLYCISATTLQSLYEAKPGRWNREYEAQYQAQRNASEPDRHALEYLRYLRLLAYLRQREPDDQIGYSILIYRLTDADLLAALEGPPTELESRPSIVLGGS